jgi:hypothetical protein
VADRPGEGALGDLLEVPYLFLRSAENQTHSAKARSQFLR